MCGKEENRRKSPPQQTALSARACAVSLRKRKASGQKGKVDLREKACRELGVGDNAGILNVLSAMRMIDLHFKSSLSEAEVGRRPG